MNRLQKVILILLLLFSFTILFAGYYPANPIVAAYYNISGGFAGISDTYAVFSYKDDYYCREAHRFEEKIYKISKTDYDNCLRLVNQNNWHILDGYNVSKGGSDMFFERVSLRRANGKMLFGCSDRSFPAESNIECLADYIEHNITEKQDYDKKAYNDCVIERSNFCCISCYFPCITIYQKNNTDSYYCERRKSNCSYQVIRISKQAYETMRQEIMTILEDMKAADPDQQNKSDNFIYFSSMIEGDVRYCLPPELDTAELEEVCERLYNCVKQLDQQSCELEAEQKALEQNEQE